MCELVMHAEEPISTSESTERLEKIFNSTYLKVDLKQVAYNATQINAEEKLNY